MYHYNLDSNSIKQGVNFSKRAKYISLSICHWILVADFQMVVIPNWITLKIWSLNICVMFTQDTPKNKAGFGCPVYWKKLYINLIFNDW